MQLFLLAMRISWRLVFTLRDSAMELAPIVSILLPFKSDQLSVPFEEMKKNGKYTQDEDAKDFCSL